MTEMQRVIKYAAIGLAVLLIAMIVGGIVGAVGLIAGFFEPQDAVRDFQSYSVSGEIHSLDIELAAADLCIREGESFSVESNLPYLKVRERGGVLIIEETEWRRSSASYRDAALTVYVPAGTVYRDVSIATGAGRLTAEALSAERLDLAFGAGEVSFGSLTATESADIEGGTGRVTVSGGMLQNLDLDMGLGQLQLRAALRGDCELDLGVGESRVTLLGARDDYRLLPEKGLGSMTVDGETLAAGSVVGEGGNRVRLSGGVGTIAVTFEAIS